MMRLCSFMALKRSSWASFNLNGIREPGVFPFIFVKFCRKNLGSFNNLRASCFLSFIYLFSFLYGLIILINQVGGGRRDNHFIFTIGELLCFRNIGSRFNDGFFPLAFTGRFPTFV